MRLSITPKLKLSFILVILFYYSSSALAEPESLFCSVTHEKAIPCSQERLKELAKNYLDAEKVKKQPLLCRQVDAVMLDVIHNRPANKISIGGKSAEICLDRKYEYLVSNQKLKIRQNCQPTEKELMSPSGFIDGTIEYFTNARSTKEVAEISYELVKQMNPQSNQMAQNIVEPLIAFESSLGKCYPASMKQEVINRNARDAESANKDRLAEDKADALQKKYANAPSCNDLGMTKYKHMGLKFMIAVSSGEPPEPCKECKPPTNCYIVIPKALR
jgi:hypothetical protein